MVYQLIYVSSATKKFERPALDDLLRRARARNLACGVTGAMLYYDGSIIQVLEGQETIVKTLVARISDDRRHRGIRIINAGQVAKREFSDWSMAYKPIRRADTELRGLLRLVKSDDKIARAQGDGIAGQVLRGFYQTNFERAA
jgi:hypothetical protein